MGMINMFTDFVSKTRLFEHVFHRVDALRKIESMQDTVNLHLMKILLFNYQDRWISHWKGDINKALASVVPDRVRLKRHGHLEAGDYFRIFYRDPFEDNDHMVPSLVEEVEELFVGGEASPARKDVDPDRFREFWWKSSFHLMDSDRGTVLRLVDRYFVEECSLDRELLGKI